jgi:hypothetical protein
MVMWSGTTKVSTALRRGSLVAGVAVRMGSERRSRTDMMKE